MTVLPSKVALTMISLLMALGACMRHEQYRLTAPMAPCALRQPVLDCTDTDLMRGTGNDQDFLLGVVEFDDQGNFWNRNQALSLLQRLQRLGADRKAVYVVFAHGWKHNASATDGNLETVTQVLRRLQQAEYRYRAEGKHRQARQIVGIYLGWRGLSVKVPIAREFTFWGRKAVAQDIGKGAVLEILELIEAMYHRNRANGVSGPQSRLVVMGHSFGGAVIYSALAHVLIDRLANGLFRRGRPNTYGDLVVLINPAFEAQQFATFFDFAKSQEYIAEPPILAVLTSRADDATKKIFPLGRWFATVFDSYQSRDQRSRDRKTIGHYPGYWTHRLEPVNDREAVAEYANPSMQTLSTMRDQFCQSEQQIEIGAAALQRYVGSAMPAGSPYLNVSVDREIIRDHNDFANPRLLRFLEALVGVATAPGLAPCNAAPLR